MSYLTEAFKELNIIDEDLFPTDSEGFNKLKDFMKSDIDDDIIVYDTDAETEDDLLDSYEGKVILQCDVCKSHFFKEPKNVIIEDDADLANVGEECCYCHNDMGYKVVGVVAPYEQEEVKEEEPKAEEPQIADAEKEERAEIVHGEKDLDNIDAEADIEVNESLTEAKEEVCPECGKNPCECDNGFDESLSEKVSSKLHIDNEFGEGAIERIPDKIWDLLYERDKDDMLDEVEDAQLDGTIISKLGQYVLVRFDKLPRKTYLMARNPDTGRLSAAHEDEVINDFGKDEADKFFNTVEGEDKILDCDNFGFIKLLKNYARDIVKKYTSSIEIEECDAVKEECGEDKKDEEELKEETNYEKVMKVLRAAKKEESLEEDFKDVSITTDDTHMEMTSDENGKVTVTTEPIKNEEVPEAEVEAEVIKPLSADEKDKIINKEEDDGQVALDIEDEADLDFDEINDEDLNELGEQYFTRVYDNVQSFKSTACKLNESDVTLDGELTFKSGKKVNTSFKFNEAFVTKSGKVKLLGENLQFAKNKRAFTLTGTLNEKKLIIEKFTYNYRAKDEKTGKSTKLYGTISK